MQTKPPTRHEARALGFTRYFTGKPCSKGHIAERSLTGTCVDCQQLANKGWAQRNPNEANVRSARWRARNPEKAYQISIRSKRKAMGIPEPLRPKPTHCELCEKHITAKGKMHLDHNHVTGKFRGWLCNTCNWSLGQLGDSITGLRKAIQYLEQSEQMPK